ncbi:hypothetical protein ACEPPN_018466 [Leptodophora sp. 'Broadleaf-Isolate-01']
MADRYSLLQVAGPSTPFSGKALHPSGNAMITCWFRFVTFNLVAFQHVIFQDVARRSSSEQGGWNDDDDHDAGPPTFLSLQRWHCINRISETYQARVGFKDNYLLNMGMTAIKGPDRAGHASQEPRRVETGSVSGPSGLGIAERSAL